MTMKKVAIKTETNKKSKTLTLWSITAYCTKFRYILLEWHGPSLSESMLNMKRVLVFFLVYNRFDVGYKDVEEPAANSRRAGGLVSAVACGVLDPVQDDEGHAAKHDHDTENEED